MRTRVVSYALIVVVFMMLTMMAMSAAAHDLKHATHHHAGMHGKGICAWMCSAASAAFGDAVQPLILLSLEEKLVPFIPILHLIEFSSNHQARAPPSVPA